MWSRTLPGVTKRLLLEPTFTHTRRLARGGGIELTLTTPGAVTILTLRHRNSSPAARAGERAVGGSVNKAYRRKYAEHKHGLPQPTTNS